jgi:hypothetical protein
MGEDGVTFSEGDLRHVMRMVLLDNKDCKMTEALMLGIEESIVLYLKSVTHSEPGVLENGNGTSS